VPRSKSFAKKAGKQSVISLRFKSADLQAQIEKLLKRASTRLSHKEKASRYNLVKKAKKKTIEALIPGKLERSDPKAADAKEKEVKTFSRTTSVQPHARNDLKLTKSASMDAIAK